MKQTIEIPFADLAIIRLKCKHCQTAMEVPVTQLVNCTLVCSGCGKAHRRPDVDKAIDQLASAIQFFQKYQDLEVEIVIPGSP